MSKQIALITSPATNPTQEVPNSCNDLMNRTRVVWNKRSALWLSLVSGNILKQRNPNVNRLKMMLIGLTLLSAAVSQAVAQVAKDPGTGAQAVHEIQVTLRKYEFNPGSLHVRKGERVKLVMTAADHDHGFKLDDFDINQKILRLPRLRQSGLGQPEVVDAFHQRLEGVQLHGFSEIAVRLQLITFCDVSFRIGGGQDHGGDGFQALVFLDLSENLAAIHFGEVQIQQDEIGAGIILVRSFTP
jgi:hypothetical protein